MVGAEPREWSILSRPRWMIGFIFRGSTTLSLMQNKDGTLNILSLDVSLISPQPCPQGLKWMKEEDVMKYMNDHEGEKKRLLRCLSDSSE